MYFRFLYRSGSNFILMYIYGHKVLQPKKYIIFCQYCVMINAYCHVFLAMCYVVRNKIQFIPESVPTLQPLVWTSLWGILFYSSNFFHYCYRYWSRLSEAFLKWVLSFFFYHGKFPKNCTDPDWAKANKSRTPLYCCSTQRCGRPSSFLTRSHYSHLPALSPTPQKFMINKWLVGGGLG